MNGLTHEAIQDVAQLATKAALPAVLNIPGQVQHKVTVYTGDEIKEMVLDPQPRKHTLSTLGSFVDFTNNIADKHGGGNPVVWVSEDSLTVVVNDGERRDQATLTLKKTPQLQLLQNNTTAQPRSQADIIKFLRIDMAGTLPDGKGLIGLLREMKFDQNTAGSGNVQHGRESMGKSIEAQVLGLSAIPEELTLNVRLFDVPDIQTVAQIQCAIDIIVMAQQFRIVPLPMQIQNALAMGMEKILETLEQLDCPVYDGKP